jgi:hypothetical protein
MNLRRLFTLGRMNKDADERLLPDGEFRHAENILVVNSEGATVGSVQKSFSNKKMTNLNLGTNVKCLLGLEDEYEKKIYWFTKSNQGCYLIEWDDTNQIATIVLEDTRPIGSRVLDLDENFLITGIFKIINSDPNKNLFGWTDDNIEPCCINIARAKAYGANNFTKEDIYLIKKPPFYSPEILPINVAGLTNNMEEKFLSFCYRFKYLDGEYSALSTYANYAFNPKDFDLNFYTLDNKGMINAFNALKISFDTGERQVTDIQLVFKESNSNALYLIETFNKANEGWGDNQIKDYTFSNNKLYTQLPEKELYRACDYVPLKAKSLTLINNIPIFGDYLEGRDIVDGSGKKIVPDYQVSMTNDPIDTGTDFTATFPLPNQIHLTNPGITLIKGNKLVFTFNVLLDGTATYSGSFYYILPDNYATLLDVFATLDFDGFLSIINSDFQNNFEYDAPDGWVEDVPPTITYTIVGGVPVFTITPVTFIDTTDSDTPHTVDFSFLPESNVTLVASSNSTSCKTNRDYEVGIVYEDDFGRKTTVLTALYNTIHISQLYSVFKNRLKVTLNSPPPFWAKRYHIVVKAQPLQYQIIYINRFYNEDFYVWAKLEAENKDKVKVGDILIVKKGPDPLPNPVKVKVLEIKEQIKDFITANVDEDGNLIIEEAGVYMKTRPDGFSMDFDDYKIHSNDAKASSGGQPIAYLDLFTDLTGPTELAIPQGSSISLFFDSTFHYDAGWRHSIYDVIHYAQRNYATLEEWFNENIIGRNLFITNNANQIKNYGPQLSLVRGAVVGNFNGNPTFSPNPSGKLYLRLVGLETGGSGGRNGRCDAKIVVRSSSGFYVFETEPKQAENKIFYETSQTFDIINGNHEGNLQDQDVSVFTPAILDLDFFNCYTMGNGVESYRVRDGFNTNALNIDLRPSAASAEGYKSIRRKASLTHGEPYVESTNTNGLNEFNLSTGNFKDLDKQYGSIQKLLTRDNDIVVLQEEKASKVLFKKKILYNEDGTSNIVSTDVVLGDQITYLGQNGIGKAPESVAVNNYQIYYANPLRGIMQRLSIDGVEEIIYGMVDWFRDKFTLNPTAFKIGGYDPYHGQYLISIGNEPDKAFTVECGALISKFEQTGPFTYVFNLNDLEGDILLNFNISTGSATITAEYEGSIYVESNVSGSGTLNIPRTDPYEKEVTVTITPVSESISYDISNVCPLGVPMDLISIVLGDSNDTDKTITDRFRWGGSNFYSDTILFGSDRISKFLLETGIEGQGKFPQRNSIISIESFKDISNNADFSLDQCNRIGYLISEDVYTSADIDTITAAATWLTLSSVGASYVGNLLFSKTTNAEKLYLIWDYEDKKPNLSDDVISVLEGTSVTVSVLSNDVIAAGEFVVEIFTGPEFGDVILNEDNTITYANTTSTETDSITYSVTQNGCTSTATIYLSVYTEETAPSLFVYHASRGNVTTFDCGDSFDVFNPRTIYVDVQPYSTPDWFTLITQVFSNEAGTTPAQAGWYLDSILSIGTGVHYLYWNGTEVTTTGYCPGELG